MALPKTQSALRQLLEGPSAVDPVDSLHAQYQHATHQQRTRTRTFITSLLAAIQAEPPLSERAVLHLIDAVERLRITEAASYLRDLIDIRYLATHYRGEHLHGFALRALRALGGIDAWQTWQREVAFRDYAPIAFSFVRDSSPD